MDSADATGPERVGVLYSEDGMLLTRHKTRKVIRDAASQIVPGMVEDDALDIVRRLLEDAGMDRTWHPSRVRFGSNTVWPMPEPSTRGVVLADDDIFLIDIAPRLGPWEGGGGASFVVGNRHEYAKCVADAESLFEELRLLWIAQRLSGAALYRRAGEIAHAMGWHLGRHEMGHRISDYPHSAMHRGSLADFHGTPSPLMWAIEIHLLDPERRFGAFYEDVLLRDSYYERSK